jgi:2-amino-4-hydroxy-6-hydroxymethyldihydropteridine diphosphokinase
MKEVFILLGSNRGDRINYLAGGVQMIGEHAGKILKKSTIYETEPWGFEDSKPFLNQVVEIETVFQPGELLEKIMTIEAKLGRIRPFKSCNCSVLNQQTELHMTESGNQHSASIYSGRTIDLDILLYGERIVFNDNLMIPHPRLHERRFTLVPLNEIIPGLVHPVLKKTISMLLKECTDQGKVSSFCQ